MRLNSVTAYHVLLLIALIIAAVLLLMVGQTSILIKIVSIFILIGYLFCTIPAVTHVLDWFIFGRQFARMKTQSVKFQPLMPEMATAPR